ncbi:MAG TPA: hypothetical protein V6D22_09985 [Candidatus Obscuribacterales bacterium]
MKARYFAAALTVAIMTAGGLCPQLNAQPANNFFGSYPTGGTPDPSATGATPSGPTSVTGASSPSGPPAGDFSSDEKRVQKKYRSNVHHAQDLINKGSSMMKSHDNKVAKKGKVLKEIGEKALADLKANNPFPDLATKDQKIH